MKDIMKGRLCQKSQSLWQRELEREAYEVPEAESLPTATLGLT